MNGDVGEESGIVNQVSSMPGLYVFHRRFDVDSAVVAVMPPLRERTAPVNTARDDGCAIDLHNNATGLKPQALQTDTWGAEGSPSLKKQIGAASPSSLQQTGPKC